MCTQDVEQIIRAFRDVAEDLAIEILAEFSEEDMQHLEKTLGRLQIAADIFTSNGVDVPAPLKELLRHRLQ